MDKEFLKVIVGGLFGGGLTLLGIFVNNKLIDRREQKRKDHDEDTFISSVKCEAKSLRELVEQRHSVFLNGEFNNDKFIDATFTISHDYLEFLTKNVSKIAEIRNEDIRFRVQRLIIFGKSYIDSLKTHCDLLEDYSLLILDYFPGQIIPHSDEENSRRHKAYIKLSILQAFDESLVSQAKDLVEKLKEFEDFVGNTKLAK